VLHFPGRQCGAFQQDLHKSGEGDEGETAIAVAVLLVRRVAGGGHQGESPHEDLDLGVIEAHVQLVSEQQVPEFFKGNHTLSLRVQIPEDATEVVPGGEESGSELWEKFIQAGLEALLSSDLFLYGLEETPIVHHGLPGKGGGSKVIEVGAAEWVREPRPRGQGGLGQSINASRGGSREGAT